MAYVGFTSNDDIIPNDTSTQVTTITNSNIAPNDAIPESYILANFCTLSNNCLEQSWIFTNAWSLSDQYILLQIAAFFQINIFSFVYIVPVVH